MGLTYADSAALMTDLDFRGRIKVAALHFASYITGEDPGTAAHNTRFKWAQQTLSAPDMVAVQVQPVVVGDPNVQAQGSSIPDDQLQSAVETAIQKLL